jgi:hypothetical protein
MESIDDKSKPWHPPLTSLGSKPEHNGVYVGKMYHNKVNRLQTPDNYFGVHHGRPMANDNRAFSASPLHGNWIPERMVPILQPTLASKLYH